MTATALTTACDQAERDFNPRVAVPDFAAITQARSEANQRIINTHLAATIAYGSGANEAIDLYRPEPGTPARGDVLGIYIHGGYWRAGHRRDSAYAAAPFLRAGVPCASIGYELCPHVNLGQIVASLRAATRSLLLRGGDAFGLRPRRFVLCGASAGAHLAACVAMDSTLPWGEELPHAILMTGIYDLRPVLQISVNREIGLDLPAALSLSPLLASDRPRLSGATLTVGADEPGPWRQQTQDYTERLQHLGIPASWAVIAGTNHFSLGSTLLDDRSALSALVARSLAPR